MEAQYACTLADYEEVLTTARSKTLKQKIFGAVIMIALLTLGAAVMVGLGFRQSVAFPIMVFLLAAFLAHSPLRSISFMGEERLCQSPELFPRAHASGR